MSYAVPATALALVLLPQLVLYSHITDDAYISFRYADRLASGQGLTFNPGQRVEGFSNPLWTLLIAGAVCLTPFSAPEIARFLGVVCSLLTVICAWRILSKDQIDPGARIANFALFCAMLLSNPGFHVYATAGLEGPLLMFLLTVGVALSLKEAGAWRCLAGFAFGLASITRPEGLLYGLLWFAFTFKLRSSAAWSPRRELARLACLLLPWLAYELFRWLYFGAFLPNTFAAKPPGVFGGDTLAVRYLWPWVMSLGGLLALSPLLLLRVDYSRQSKVLFRASAGPLIAAALFAMYARGDWMPFGRFVVPVWPLICLAVAAWLHSAIETLKGNSFLRFPGAAKCIVALMLVLTSMLTWADPLIEYIDNKGINMLMRGHDQIAAGQWLSENVREGTTVATIRLGGISYAAPDLVFWDLNGLTDKEQAVFVSQGRPGGPRSDPILNRFPQILAMVEYAGSQGPKAVADIRKWIDEHYSYIRSVPQGRSGAFDLWILKRCPDVMKQATGQRRPSNQPIEPVPTINGNLGGRK
ncbi:MAG: DUF2029 domain-containing protein [Sedimentisphaerales bacterium]|nr:DUF2029 domain-containing protein [Sedimentisphaerales bacterium]